MFQYLSTLGHGSNIKQLDKTDSIHRLICVFTFKNVMQPLILLTTPSLVKMNGYIFRGSNFHFKLPPFSDSRRAVTVVSYWLTLLHSEWPKLDGVLAVLNAIVLKYGR